MVTYNQICKTNDIPCNLSFTVLLSANRQNLQSAKFLLKKLWIFKFGYLKKILDKHQNIILYIKKIFLLPTVNKPYENLFSYLKKMHFCKLKSVYSVSVSSQVGEEVLIDVSQQMLSMEM